MKVDAVCTNSASCLKSITRLLRLGVLGCEDLQITVYTHLGEDRFEFSQTASAGWTDAAARDPQPRRQLIVARRILRKDRHHNFALEGCESLKGLAHHFFAFPSADIVIGQGNFHNRRLL